MRLAIWDTYVSRDDGSVLHFDVVVPESHSNWAEVLKAACGYAAGRGIPDVRVTAEECRFCHWEDPDPVHLDAINEHGFAIIPLEDIPAELPEQPTRREMILHLRGHYPQYRFADFRQVSTEQVLQRIKEVGHGQQSV